MRRLISLFIAAAICPMQAGAQSTVSLSRPEPDWSVQLGVGTRLPVGYYGGQAGEMRAALIDVRRTTAGRMIWRFDAWLIQRQPRENPPHIYYSSDDRLVRKLDNTRLLAFTVGGAFPMRLASEASIEPTFGIGIVPFAKGVFVPDGSVPTGARSTISRSGGGFVVPLGLSLRLWRLSIEQHLLQVIGADDALYNGENAPLMISYRIYPW